MLTDVDIFNRVIREKIFIDALKVGIYVSKKGEVDTVGLINYAWKNNKIVVVPKVEQKSLAFYRINKWEDLELNKWGILEPKIGLERDDLYKVVLMIVPGMHFDSFKYRLGHGTGYYDKALQNFSGYKIGLAYSHQLQYECKHDRLDVPMDLIISEKVCIL